MRRLCKTLADARKQAGLRQSDLADRVSVTGSVISRLEAGATEAPAFRDIVLVGRELGFSPTTLAQIAGLYPGGDFDRPRDPRSYQIDALMEQLPETHREELFTLLVTLAQSRVLAF